MSEELSGLCDFVHVYIAEAHPNDEWHMEVKTIDYSQPKTQDERRKAAEKLQSLYSPKAPFVMDAMDNALMKRYNAWPERLYVVEKGQIVY